MFLKLFIARLKYLFPPDTIVLQASYSSIRHVLLYYTKGISNHDTSNKIITATSVAALTLTQPVVEYGRVLTRSCQFFTFAARNQRSI